MFLCHFICKSCPWCTWKKYWNLWSKFLFFYNSVQHYLSGLSVDVLCLTDGDIFFSLIKVTHSFAFASLNLLRFGLGMFPSQGFSPMYMNQGEWPYSVRIRTPPPNITPSGAAQRTFSTLPNVTYLVGLLSAHPHPRPTSHGTALEEASCCCCCWWWRVAIVMKITAFL